MTSELETHLVSVERVKEYSETATEVNNKLKKKKNLLVTCISQCTKRPLDYTLVFLRVGLYVLIWR